MIAGGKFRSGRFAVSRRSAVRRDPRAAYVANGLVPALVADFQQGNYYSDAVTGFDGLLKHTRASEGAYTDATGRLVWATADAPRFDHRLQDGEWVNKGILLEGEARTNLLLNSQVFSHSGWGKSRASIVANDAEAPDGTLTASRLISTASTYDGAVRQSASYTTDQRLSFSVYAKAGDRDYVFLRERTHGFAKDSYFDLRQGRLGSVNSVHTADMQYAGKGWYRCSITVQANRSAASDFEIYNSEDDLNTASTKPGFTYIWGAQVEVGSSASSYIKTTEAPITREPDQLTLRPLGEPAAGNAVSLAVSGDAAVIEQIAPVDVLNWTNGFGNEIVYQIGGSASGLGRIQLRQVVNGSETLLATAPGEVGPGVSAEFAIASRHTDTEIELSNAGIGGVSGRPVLDSAEMILGGGLMGHIALIRVWAGDIGTAGLLAN